jgi:serine/threonine protein kinase/Leucine-rich repeat (LRR) protein
MALISCPDRSLLQRFLLGKAPEVICGPLELHLAECQSCAEAAESVNSADDLTEALQQAAVMADELLCNQDQWLAIAIERAKGLTNLLETDRGTATEIHVATDPKPDPNSRPPSSVRYNLDFLASPQQSDELGRLGDYRVLKVLGVGGMGMVFKAEDLRLGRAVALKVMRPEVAAKPQSRERFVREARATAALAHDHIVQIHQVGEDRGVPYLAMQYLQGQSLQTVLNRIGKLRPKDVARIGKEVALGLAAAHDKGLIHRDIKPDNIWIEAKTHRVRILDFGLARDVESDAGLTQTGAILGTPRYMAPEQVSGEDVKYHADLFSLGSMLYHLVSGQPAFQGHNLPSLLYAIVNHDPLPLDQVIEGIDPELSAVISELINKRPSTRPESALSVAKRLSAIELRLRRSGTAAATPPSADSPPPPAPPAQRPDEPAKARQYRRRRIGWTIGATAASLLLATTVATNRFWPNVRLDRETVATADSATDSFVATVETSEPQQPQHQPEEQSQRLQRWQPDASQQQFLDQTQLLDLPSQVAAVEAKLAEANAGFDGQVIATIDDRGVMELRIEATELEEIWPILVFSELQSLACAGQGHLGNKKSKWHNLAPLTSLPLQRLDCSNTSVSDLSLLAHLELKELILDSTKVRDLTPLANMPLEKLSLSMCQISDLEPLRGMQTLRSLDLYGTPISNLAAIGDLKLVDLDCSLTEVSDFRPLYRMPLKRLYAFNTLAHDFTPLLSFSFDELGISLPAVLDDNDKKDLSSLQSKAFVSSPPGLSHKKSKTLVSKTDFFAKHSADRKEIDDFVANASLLEASQQVKEIARELERRNLDDEVGFLPTIHDGAIGEVIIQGGAAVDLSPLRALTRLKKLTIVDNWFYLDLSPLSGLPLEELTCDGNHLIRNGPILAKMPKLLSINDMWVGVALPGFDVVGQLDPQLVEAWVSAGAVLNWRPYFDSKNPLSASQRSGLPTFSFGQYFNQPSDQHWDANALAELPVPNHPFGIELSGSSVSDAQFASISRFPRLQQLEVQQHLLTDRGFAHIRSLKKLSFLRLNTPRITHNAFKDLSALPSLRRLECVLMPLTDLGVQAIAHHCHGLESLILDRTAITDAATKALPRLTRLQHLVLSKNSLSDLAVEPLSEMQSLRSIHLDHNDLTGAGLKRLCNLADLEVLKLGNTKITDESLVDLPVHPKIVHLDLDHCEIGNEGLQAIVESFPGLRFLNIGHSAITDKGFECLAKLDKLKSLYFRNASVSDVAMEHVARLTNLSFIDLGSTKVTDAGLMKLIELSQLRWMAIHDTSITADGRETFRRQRPMCQFYY